MKLTVEFKVSGWGSMDFCVQVDLGLVRGAYVCPFGGPVVLPFKLLVVVVVVVVDVVVAVVLVVVTVAAAVSAVSAAAAARVAE